MCSAEAMEGVEAAPAVGARDAAATIPSAPASEKNGASLGDEGGRLAVGAQAKEAAALFHGGSYSECLAILHQLLQKKEDDIKVQHNIALAEFYRDGCSDPQKLLDTLARLKSFASSDRQSKTEEHARSAEEQADVAGSTPDAPLPAEDYDSSALSLNTAVIFFHMRQYTKALAILELLYRNIEPIEETAALRICQMILEITLSSGQPAKAAAVLQYMEKVFGGLQSSGESGTSAQAQPPILTVSQSATATVVPGSSGTAENSFASSSTSGTSSLIASPNGETGLIRTSSEEVLDEEALSIELEIEGSHGVRSAPLPKGVPRASGVQKPSPAVVESRLAIHLYKVRLLLLTRNFKAAKREVKAALNISRDNLAALVLKAQLEYCRANYRKAIKILTTCNSRAEGIPRAMFLSNLGCIHHRIHKDHVASFYFLKALQSCPQAKAGKNVDLMTFSEDKSLSILYNAGLQRLACGDPVLASKCLQEAACLFYNQPVLWLRLAECTIVALEKGLLDAPTPAFPAKREELRVSIVGDGKLRRVILPSGSLNPTLKHSGSWEPVFEEIHTSSGQPDIEGPEGSLPFGKPHKLTMTFARQCLRNALFLLTRLQARDVGSPATADAKEGDDGMGGVQEQGAEVKGSCSLAGQGNPDSDLKESKVFAGATGSIASAIAAYEEERRKENSYVRQLVLANLSYVELCLENPVVALATARTILAQADSVKMLTFLAHMYAAESLCMLDRTKEAAEHIAKCMEDNSMAETSSHSADDEGTSKWRSGDNSEASVDVDDVNPDVSSPKIRAETLHPASSDLSKLTGPRARASLYVNLAAIHIMQGELEQAYHMATQAAALWPESPASTLSVVFVHLSRGQTEEAISLLKSCRSLYVVPKSAYWTKD